MRLIVGLGNPGKQYEKNRHNVGFLILNKIAEKKEIVFRLEPHYESRFAEMGDLKHLPAGKAGRTKLVEPQTFMNESGRAVGKCKDYWKIDSEDIWVIHDDVDLEFGKIRISLGGSSAGHKGVQSIIETIGESFWRIRIGVGKSDQVATDDWVLKNLTKDEAKNYELVIDNVADLVLEFLDKGIKEETINIVEAPPWRGANTTKGFKWAHKNQS